MLIEAQELLDAREREVSRLSTAVGKYQSRMQGLQDQVSNYKTL